MKKFSLKNVKMKGCYTLKKMDDTFGLAALKLREQEGSLLEYLGEHIIGVVLVAIIMAGLALIVKDTVMPNITEKIKNAFTFA